MSWHVQLKSCKCYIMPPSLSSYTFWIDSFSFKKWKNRLYSKKMSFKLDPILETEMLIDMYYARGGSKLYHLYHMICCFEVLNLGPYFSPKIRLFVLLILVVDKILFISSQKILCKTTLAVVLKHIQDLEIIPILIPLHLFPPAEMLIRTQWQ